MVYQKFTNLLVHCQIVQLSNIAITMLDFSCNRKSCCSQPLCLIICITLKGKEKHITIAFQSNTYKESYQEKKQRNEAKKMKIDNFTGSKREKLNISFAILEKWTILYHQSIPHFGCTKIIFVDWIIISVQYLY